MKNNIKEFKDKFGLSYQDLEDMTGLHRAHISGIANDYNNPSLSSAYIISNALSANIDDIFPNPLNLMNDSKLKAYVNRYNAWLAEYGKKVQRGKRVGELKYPSSTIEKILAELRPLIHSEFSK